MTLTTAMTIFALRYCLVSASYAPMACTRYLMEHWSEFTPQLQAQIREEIQERLATTTLATDLAMTWESFLHFTMNDPEV
jgi:hypothetical protein